MSFRILITNIGIANRTGTEIVAMDLARSLSALGHQPMIWTPVLCRELVADLTAAGIPVTDKLDDLPFPPDVIHGHHHLETIAAIQKFRGVPAIFVSHSGHWWIDAPPRHPSIRRYAAVDDFCRERLDATSWIPMDRVAVIRNAVDLDRFHARGPLPARPKRAAVFSNYAEPGGYLEVIRAACCRLGIELDAIGDAAGTLTTRPESRLRNYDLVFAKARCALEAMAVGCAVVLCDTAGLGEMVDSQNFEELRRWNFGFRVLTRRITAAAIDAEIARYDPSNAARVSSLVRAEGNLQDAVASWLACYRAALDTKPLDLPDDYPATSPIQTEDQAGLRLRFVEVPAQAASESNFAAAVALENQSNIAVATAPPWHSLLMYRWLDRSGGTAVEHGFRSILQPPSRPGSETRYPLRVFAPSGPGHYTLRATIVQEGWRWLDQLSPRLLCETGVEIL